VENFRELMTSGVVLLYLSSSFLLNNLANILHPTPRTMDMDGASAANNTVTTANDGTGTLLNPHLNSQMD
jgi:hypothetical protein